MCVNNKTRNIAPAAAVNQFLCSQTAAGFKIFVKLCAPLKKPDTGQKRATGGGVGGVEVGIR